MTEDLQERPEETFAALQERAADLFTQVKLRDVSESVQDITERINTLKAELSRARSRGYSFAAYLEHKVEVLERQWQTTQKDIQQALNQEVTRLKTEQARVETLLDNANQYATNPKMLMALMPKLEQEMNELESKLYAVREAMEERSAKLEQDLYQATGQLHDIHGYLDEADEASFPFLPDEKLFLSASGEWVATGKGNQDPDGILFLTDKRLIFEQKETTGKKLGIFGGKHTQELEWAVDIDQIESVVAENKGLFGGKDMLNFKLTSGAPYPAITVEVKGGVQSKFWAAQIERMVKGETNDERAIKPDAEMLKAIRSTPTACPVCGANLPVPAAGQAQLECEYCGTVIQL